MVVCVRVAVQQRVAPGDSRDFQIICARFQVGYAEVCLFAVFAGDGQSFQLGLSVGPIDGTRPKVYVTSAAAIVGKEEGDVARRIHRETVEILVISAGQVPGYPLEHGHRRRSADGAVAGGLFYICNLRNGRLGGISGPGGDVGKLVDVGFPAAAAEEDISGDLGLRGRVRPAEEQPDPRRYHQNNRNPQKIRPNVAPYRAPSFHGSHNSSLLFECSCQLLCRLNRFVTVLKMEPSAGVGVSGKRLRAT